MTTTKRQPLHPGRPSRYAWILIPVLLLTIAGLWITDPQTTYESPPLRFLLNFVFTWLVSLCIGYLTARSFLDNGQPGLLMLGCGSLLWGFTSLAAATLINSNGNLTITVHNLGILGTALCHFGGSQWRGRLLRPRRWLVAGYMTVLAAVVLIVWAAKTGWTPIFFVPGQGGTLVRQVVLLVSITLYLLVACLMWTFNKRQSSQFFYWYSLGLTLLALGLAGVMIQSTLGSALNWAGRITQYLGGTYLFIAAIMAAREKSTWKISLQEIGKAWQEYMVLARHRQQPFKLALHYGLAVVAVAAALALRMALETGVGPGLPTYITFYPAVMVAAVLTGFVPGIVATALTSLAVAFWVLPPVGQLSVAAPVDRLGLVIFICMGLAMSAFAEFYRRNRDKAAAYDREIALHDAKTRLAMFAEATFEGIVESKAGQIVDCNQQLAQMLGYSIAELKGQLLSDLIGSENIGRLLENIWQGQNSITEHTLLRKDGASITVEVHGRPAPSGNTIRYTAIRDITERKRIEEKLRESEAMYRGIGESIDYGVWVCTPDGRNTYVSESFLNLVGITQEQCSNFGWGEVLHPDETERTIAAWQECVRTGGIWDTEHRFRGVDGQWHHVLARGVPVRNKNGEITSWAGINIDISRLKQAEEALQVLNAELELRVEQRTLELQDTQRQYLHAEKLSAIGKLSASIAHEFNNPLQGIMAVLRGLKKRAILKEEDRKLLEESITESDRMKDLIRSLQEFNRPSSGKKTWMNLHQSLDSVLLLYKSDFKGKRISVVLDYAEGLPDILAVSDQIKQVFLNVLTNAVDACQQRGGVITVSTWQQDEDTVALAIMDTGVGIQPSDTELIFQPFYTTKPEIKGTGLGLSISYGIVKHHQGEIFTKSLPGQGTTFTILLPINNPDVAE